jgi:hypothetical protein
VSRPSRASTRPVLLVLAVVATAVLVGVLVGCDRVAPPLVNVEDVEDVEDCDADDLVERDVDCGFAPRGATSRAQPSKVQPTPVAPPSSAPPPPTASRPRSR